MKLSPQISFRNIPSSEALVDAIHKRIERLNHFFPDIIGCRVLLESSHRHHDRGNHFQVRIDLTVPGKELVINRDPAKEISHKDAYIAIRDAFNAADRKLQDHAHQLHGEVKTHHSRVSLSETIPTV